MTPINSSRLRQDGRSIGLLLLHGLAGTPVEMRPLARYFSKRGFKVEVPLLAGHGGHHKDLLATQWEDWYAGIPPALAHLAESCDQVYIVGLCMGSLMATLLAARMPDKISGIALLSPTLNQFVKGHSFLQDFLPLLRKIPFLFDKIYWAEKPPYGVQDPRIQQMITQSLKGSRDGISEHGLFRVYLGTLYQLHRLASTVEQEATNVQCPTLILHSVEDTVAPVSNAHLLHSWLGTTNKALTLLSGCDHVMTIDWQRNNVNRLVETFLERCIGLDTGLSSHTRKLM